MTINLHVLVHAFERFPPDEDGSGPIWESLARALARASAKRAIPWLIAALDHRPLDAGARRTLEDGLHALSQVDPAPGQGAAWWQAWWTENRARLSPDLATLDVPVLRLPSR